MAREVPEPELIPRSSLLSMSSFSDLEGQKHLGTTLPRTEAMTQSLPPVNFSSHSHHQRSHKLNDPNQENYSAVRHQSLLSRTGGIESGFASKPGDRPSMYPRTSVLGPPTRDTMQCLRCGSRFPITNLDGYEKHIKDCYSDVR